MKNEADMNRRRIHWLIGLLFTLLSQSAWGQVNDADCLRQLQVRFEKGDLVGVLKNLPGCMKAGNLSREKMAEAYLLLAKTYLFLDNHKRAGKSMESLLKNDPEFVAHPQQQPAELVHLASAYQAIPVVSVGLRGGGNLSLVEILRVFSVGDQSTSGGQYNRRPGWNAAVLLDLYLFRNAYLTTEIQATGKYFDFSEQPLPATVVGYREQLYYLELPVSFKYEIGNRKLSPYIRAGGSAGRLLSASKTNLNTTIQAELTQQELQGPPVNIALQRTPMEWNLFLGGGLGIKTGYDRAFIELRYRRGIYNVVQPDARFSIPELQYYYYQADDDFRIHNLEFSMGYVHKFWRVRKKKGGKR